jgi:hypothetical protein
MPAEELIKLTAMMALSRRLHGICRFIGALRRKT